jgi:phage terminase large subunit-like protein
MKKKTKKVVKKTKQCVGRPARDRQEILKDGYNLAAYSGKKKKAKLPPALKISVKREGWMTDGDFEYLKVKYFYEHFLKHPDGKPFLLTDWEEEIISALMGTLTEDGKRRYRKAYLSMPRKCGKSTLMAGLLLYFLVVISEKHRFMQIYSAAGSSEQAGVVFRCAAEMVRQSPQLSKIIRIIEFTKRMRNLRTDATYFVLSRESATAHGINAAMCVFDETFNQKDSFLWDAIERSMGTQPEPLLVSISTAGTNRESLCRRLYDYGKKVNSGEVVDPTFYTRIYEADDSDDWEDEAVWLKANPSIKSGFRFLDEMRSSFNRAREIPSEENMFRNQYLNMWAAAEVRWIASAVWDGCGAPFTISELEGRECWVGLDLGASRDITAAVFLFPPLNDDDIFRLVCFFWIPSENIEERGRKDGAPYSSWVKAGFIMTTPGNIVDYAGIRSTLNEFAGKFKILGVGIDPWNSAQIAPALVEDGFEVVDIRQGYQTLSAPMKEFERLLLSKKISHNNNPVLRWMADSTVVVTDPAGNIKPDKSQRNRRIDGIVASIIAISIFMKAPKESGSVYDHRGILTISPFDDRPKREIEPRPVLPPMGKIPFCPRCYKQEVQRIIFMKEITPDLFVCEEGCGLKLTGDDLLKL